MKKNKINNINGFTLIELVVIITIIAILWVWGLNLFNSYKEDMKISDEMWDIRQYWLLLSNIISKNWDIMLNYCKNTLWTYDVNCFKIDSNWDWNWDWICDWKEGDLISDPDCDNWCVIIDCSVTECTWNNEYYDFIELFNNNITYNYTLKTDSYMEKIWYRICPEKDSSSIQLIWKWMETEFWTFNPSFTLFYNWRTIYNYNSNP